MVVPAGEGGGVQVLRPRVMVAAGVRERDERLAQALVAGPTEAGGLAFAGLDRDGGLAGVAGEGVVAPAAVADLRSLDQQIAQLESEQGKLIESEKQLQAKTEQFRSKKEVIKAQYTAAEAQVQVSEAATGVGDSMADVGMATQRALDKTETMKARAQAVDELQAAGTFQDLTALGPGEDDVDRQLDQLGAKSAVDDEFARLKAEVQSGAPSSALPAGDTGAGDHAEARQPAAGDGEAPPPG